MLSIKSEDILTVGLYLAKTIGQFNDLEFNELINVLTAVADEMNKSGENCGIKSTYNFARNFEE